MRRDAAGGAAAGVQQRTQVGGLLQRLRRGDPRAPRARSAPAATVSWRKGSSCSRRGVHALAQRRRIAGRMHGADEDGDGVEQRRAPVLGGRCQDRRRRGAAWPCRWPRSSPRPRVRTAAGTAPPGPAYRAWPAAARACTRVSSSPASDMREPKPKSAYSAAASISRRKARIMPCTAARAASFLSSWLSRCRSRSTGSGVRASSAAAATALRGAWRSHSISRTSHRWRSAWPALALAALTSAVRSQTDIACAAFSAAGRERRVRIRAPGPRTAALPRSCRNRCRASGRAAWRCGSSWCIRTARRA